MPIEKRPHHPLPAGARPGSRTPPHKVGDDETLESVAKKYGVTVRHLAVHNFGTLDPKEINWYLRHRVGCKLPTRDGNNWRFSKAADPGLIYIPMRVIQMDPIEIIGNVPAPVSLDGNHSSEILAAEKFSWESPEIKKEFEYVLIKAKIAIEGEIKQHGGVLKVTVKKDSVKLGFKKWGIDFASGLSFKEKDLEKAAEAIKNGSKEDFAKAFIKPVEGVVKSEIHRWNNFSINAEYGLETSLTPVIVRFTGEYEDSLFIEGAPFRGKFVVKGSVNIGPSKKGWAWLADKVGRPLLRAFITQGGRALAAVGEFLTAEGVLVAGTVVVGTLVGTIALTSFMAWAVADAKRKGLQDAMISNFASAYIHAVFNEQMEIIVEVKDLEMWKELLNRAQQDAEKDARSALRAAKSPAANGSAYQALLAWKNMLLSENDGNEERTKWKLRQVVEQRARQIVGR